MTEQDVYSINIEELQRILDVNIGAGLTEAEAKARLIEFGANELPETPGPSRVAMFFNQFNDFLVYILIAALAISSIFLHEILDSVAILVILILNAVLGFAQEYRAEKAMSALKDLTAPVAAVMRDGAEREIRSRDLVPGDLIVLEAGSNVPSDARIVETYNMQAEEAALTGESIAVAKTAEPVSGKNIALGDMRNLVFQGTHIVAGHGRAIVFATGKNTEMGKIAELLQVVEDEKTPLQLELSSVGKKIGSLCLVAAAVVFFAGLVRQFPAADMLLAAVSLAVAAVPEGLPAIVTISLALGLQSMAGKHAIVRRLHSVETLGSTTVICSDKTGTLTKNEMQVRRIALGIGQELMIEDADDLTGLAGLAPLLLISTLCNDARYGHGGKVFGDPTEAALLKAAAAGGFRYNELRAEMPRLNELSFDSTRKRMTTVHAGMDMAQELLGEQAPFFALTKGAPEVILNRCNRLLARGDINPLDETTKQSLADLNHKLAASAFRTIAFAYRGIAGEKYIDPDELESGMVFVGIAALSDPARPEVAEAIALCRQAKIRVIMVTGDHHETARAIAEEIGLETSTRMTITGPDLETMSAADLALRIDEISLFARVAPADKVKIVDALKSRGHIVAMTGDGVNDAPAIKRADIGIAMGISGTDVTKEASDMILADDNFATIVAAVREGRVIFDNIKKFVLFLLSCNISEIMTMFVAMVAGLPLPLLPIQILWINLVTDGLPAVALGVDPGDPGVMNRPPRTEADGVLSRQRQAQVIWQGTIIAGGALGSFVAGLRWSPTDGHAQTIVFCTMVFTQLLHAFNFRSRLFSVWSYHSLTNTYLILAAAGSAALQVLTLATPWTQAIFNTVTPSALDLIIIVIGTLVPIIIIDLIKRMARWPAF